MNSFSKIVPNFITDNALMKWSINKNQYFDLKNENFDIKTLTNFEIDWEAATESKDKVKVFKKLKIFLENTLSSGRYKEILEKRVCPTSSDATFSSSNTCITLKEFINKKDNNLEDYLKNNPNIEFGFIDENLKIIFNYLNLSIEKN